MDVVDQSFYSNYISLRLNLVARRLLPQKRRGIFEVDSLVSPIVFALLAVGLMQYKIPWHTGIIARRVRFWRDMCCTKVGCINEVITPRFISLRRAEFKYQPPETDLGRERKIFAR